MAHGACRMVNACEERLRCPLHISFPPLYLPPVAFAPVLGYA